MLLAAAALCAHGSELTLAKAGEKEARCVIVAPQTKDNRLKASIADLARCLGQVTGQKIETVQTPEEAKGRIPICIGETARKLFGPCTAKAPFGQGMRIVSGPKGIGLYGETELADSYAVYTFLDDIGCRWYFPSELGEELPRKPTLVYPVQDRALSPYTYARIPNGYGFDDDCLRRNRAGGPKVPTQHCLEAYVKGDIKDHPEWVAQYADGKPMHGRLKWSNRALANRIGEVISERQTKNPQPFWCLSPNDGARFDESPEDKALDAGDFDPTFQTISITDRILVFYNRIVERALKDHPDLNFCALAYVQYTRPPIREKPHQRLVIQIAPITYSRAHPMAMDSVPDNDALRHIVEGWGAKSDAVSYYLYGYFLASPETTFPCWRKWAGDIKTIYEKGSCRYWQPETAGNNEFFAPASWMAMRMAWDPHQDPWKLLKEACDGLYGAASGTMWKFFDAVDRIWVETPEYSGAAWGHLRRFTPERTEPLWKLLEQAEREVAGDPKKLERVRLAKASWKLTLDFVQLRRELAEGSWKGLAARSENWIDFVGTHATKYKDAKCFASCWWNKKSYSFAADYYSWFYRRTHESADALSTNSTLLVRAPLRQFAYQALTNGVDASVRPATVAEAKLWPKTDVAVETWSSLGLHNHMGSMRYRTEVEIPSIPAGKPLRIWVASTDGGLAAWCNGKRLKGWSEKAPGDHTPDKPGDFPGWFGRPVLFDATEVLRPGKNVLDFYATRGQGPNEIGTGGIMGPVTIFAEK